MNRSHVYIVFILLLALSLRLHAAMAELGIPKDDGYDHDRLALSILSGRGYVDEGISYGITAAILRLFPFFGLFFIWPFISCRKNISSYPWHRYYIIVLSDRKPCLFQEDRPNRSLHCRRLSQLHNTYEAFIYRDVVHFSLGPIDLSIYGS